MRSEEHDEVIAQYRERLVANPADKGAIGSLAGALRAKGDYQEAVHWLERLDVLENRDAALNRALRGHPGQAATAA